MKIPVSNTTAMPMYVGATMIPPGETFHFDEEVVPHHLRPAPAEEAAADVPLDPLADILSGTVPTITAALADLTIEQIERLGDLEQAGQARKGVLSAVSEVLLSRAGSGS